MTLSDLDRRLLALLKANARASVTSLASEMGASRSTVQDRISRLERRGVITRYTIETSPEGETEAFRAQVCISVAPKLDKTFERNVRKVKGVRSLLTVSGEYDYIVSVMAETSERLEASIDAIRDLDGVERTNTLFVLSEKFGSLA